MFVRGVSRWIAVLLALVLVTAACGDDDGSAFGGGGGIDAFCDLALEQEALDASVNGGEINIFEPDAFREAFENLFELTERAADIAPEEIRDDFRIVRDEIRVIAEQLEAVDYNILDVDLESEGFAGSPESEAASDRIEAFIERECGIVDSGAELSDEQLQEQLEESGAGSGLIADAFVEAGLTEEQATCLAGRFSFDELAAFEEMIGDEPPLALLEAFEECGVSISQLAALGAGFGADLGGDTDMGGGVEDFVEDMADLDPGTGGPVGDEVIEAFVSSLVDQGFTEDEARCLAGPILDTSDPDPLAAFETCGISLSRLAELGG